MTIEQSKPTAFVSYKEVHVYRFKRADGSFLEVAAGSVLAQELKDQVDNRFKKQEQVEQP